MTRPEADRTAASDARRLLLFVTDAETFGGAEGYLRTLLLHADTQRFRLGLALPARPATERLVEAAHARGAIVLPFEGRRRGLFDPGLVARATALFRRYQPAIVHFVLPSPRRCAEAVIGAFLAQVPCCIATFQLVTAVPAFAWPMGAIRALNRSLQFRTLSHGIAVSHGNRRLLVEQYGFPAARLELIPNGVDTTRFAPRPAEPAVRARWSIAPSVPLIGIFGRLSRQKGHRALFEAMPRVWQHHPAAHLVVAGTGELEHELHSLAGTIDSAARIRFVGHETHMPGALAAVDVFALPSLYEGMSFAVLEAMAAGRAVLASAVDGTVEAVQHGRSGLLVAPGDSGALADALVQLIGAPALRKQLGSAAREQVLVSFRQDTMLARTYALYHTEGP